MPFLSTGLTKGSGRYPGGIDIGSRGAGGTRLANDRLTGATASVAVAGSLNVLTNPQAIQRILFLNTSRTLWRNGCRLRCRWDKHRGQQRKRERCRRAQTARHFASRDIGFRPWRDGLPFKKTRLLQLLERQPDNVLVNRAMQLLAEQGRDARHVCLSVTMAPDKRGCLIETMRLVLSEIVNQSLPRELLDDDVILAGNRHLLISFIVFQDSSPFREVNTAS